MPDYSNHTPTSRMEMILRAMVDGLDYLENPQSVVEALLLALNEKIKNAKIYKVGPSKQFSELGIPTEANIGWVYNITDSFTTNEYFIDGAGTEFPAGTNVLGIVDQDPVTGEETYWWDTLSGFIDLSGYLLKTDAADTYLAKTDAADTYLTQTDAASTYIDQDQIGAAGGVAPLDEDGALPLDDLGVEPVTSEELAGMWE